MTDRFAEIRERVKRRYADSLGSLFRDDAQCIRDLETLLAYIDIGEPVQRPFPVVDLFGGTVLRTLSTERGPVGACNVTIRGIPLRLNPFMPPDVIRMYAGSSYVDLDLRPLKGPVFRGWEING